MALNLSADCTFTGPALPEPFVKFNLEAELNRLALLPKSTGAEGRALDEHWKFVRRKLGALVSHGGGLRVQNHVIEPLLAQLGYARIETVEAIQTREGAEDGGALLVTEDGTARLRVWCVDLDSDLDAPARRGLAYRFSHTRIAQRVLLATGERLGILTNGLELRLLISDPARVDSQLAISVDPHWKRSRDLPDSVRLLIALASPAGVKALPELIDKARLQQAKVTKDLREQARSAIREFIQELLDHPDNKSILAELTGQVANNTSAANVSPSPPSEGGEGRGEVGSINHQPSTLNQHELARALWHEGLITVYRLLFILKLESTDDPARSFSFASTSLWRNTFSPSVALAPIVRSVLDHGAQTGRLLQDGLRALFRMLSDGLQCTELNVRPMAGALFAPATTPILGRLQWSETAVAKLLDNLLWTRSGRGATARERVHYGPLDVEDLGRVYEALLELEPGITAETMCRLRRAKLEVVVPAAQGERYKPAASSPSPPSGGGEGRGEVGESAEEPDDTEDEEASAASTKKTKVEWIEEIPTDRFYLRVGLGRKATGSFYTPHSFVRFLVRETLGPLVQRVSPADDPQPCAILKLKVIDKAMGSGHFLVEACRFLGEALYDAGRRCDELAAIAEKSAEAYRASAKTKPEHDALADEMLARAATHRQRVIDLPDPDDELLRYLPSRSVEGTAGGVSHNKAIALCRRMVAVHCLYGVDKNPLAVELAKLALWIECHAEGLPLTFLDHRLVVGDSLTGPFFDHLLKYPGSQQPLDDLFTQGLTAKLTAALADALQHVRALEATVGVTVADIEAKQAAKTRLDRALAPFKILAAAWSGGVMLGPEGCDDTAYAALAKHIAENGGLPDDWLSAIGNRPSAGLLRMVAKGLGLPAVSENVSDFQTLTAELNKNAAPALPFDLAFPEVFYPDGNIANRVGFDADLGNPPWERVEIDPEEFFAGVDLSILDSKDRASRNALIERLLNNRELAAIWTGVCASVEADTNSHSVLYRHQQVEVDGRKTLGRPDTYKMFAERAFQTTREGGTVGWLVPSSFHSVEGATGVRRLYLDNTRILCCYSFENKKRLFEIDGRMKFDLVVAVVGGKTQTFPAGFYLHDDAWLFSANRADRTVTLGKELIRFLGGAHETFPEPHTQADLEHMEKQRRLGFATWGAFLESHKMVTAFGVELHRNPAFNIPIVNKGPAASLFQDATVEGWQLLPIHEGKTIEQYRDEWETLCSVSVRASDAVRTRHWRKSVPFYRFAFRRAAASNNERTMIAVVLTPGFVAEQTLAVESAPAERSHSWALLTLTIANSYAFDRELRQRVTTGLSNYLLSNIPVPNTSETSHFLVHSALRLTCNHAGYAPLWREQLGEAWREAGTAFTWPVLSGDDARWAVRAAIDAVVAHAYGLTRDQYAHVLSTFSHSSYKDAPRQCLAAFDELQSLGLEAFTKKHDPYWNIPLNENLPQPVIDLPIPAAPGEEPSPRTGELFDFQTTAAPAGSEELFTEQPIERTSSGSRKRKRART